MILLQLEVSVLKQVDLKLLKNEYVLPQNTAMYVFSPIFLVQT